MRGSLFSIPILSPSLLISMSPSSPFLPSPPYHPSSLPLSFPSPLLLPSPPLSSPSPLLLPIPPSPPYTTFFLFCAEQKHFYILGKIRQALWACQQLQEQPNLLHFTLFSTYLHMYEVQSKLNATDEIKQKLLFVHKNVFLRNFPHIYCRSECTFQWAPTTARSQRLTGL